MTKNSKSAVERLAALFVSNTRSSGRYDPKRDRAYTEPQGLMPADWQGHLDGKTGVGAVPICDDDTALWGAIDIDNHGDDLDLPIGDVAAKIDQLKIPAIACRSKSGGIHVYAFFEKPQSASRVRALLTGWAGALGYGGSEIFPKQGKLTNTKEGKRTLGNWINFPYFKADGTLRYAILDGKVASLDQFLDKAETTKVKESQMRSAAGAEHGDAPPCIQHMYQHGVPQGHRNEALYNVVVYWRKRAPEQIDQHSIEANNTIFQKPLTRQEALRTVASASRADMQYRCHEEPIRSLCKRDECLNRKFGVTPADVEKLNADNLPAFTNLVKYISEPVRWEVDVDGVKIVLKTEQLLEWRYLREKIAERLTRVVPLIKNSEWERVLSPLMKEARIVETPDDASISGVVRDRLREFAAKTDLLNKGQNSEDRKALLRGLPIVAEVDGDRCVVFRGQDFINYLKRTKSEELKGADLWMAVKSIGVFKWRTRPGKGEEINPIDVWALPIKEVMSHMTQVPQTRFQAEL